MSHKIGQYCVISSRATLGANVVVGHHCMIEDGVTIGDNTQIDSHAVIRSGVSIGEDSFVGSGCILGEQGSGRYADRNDCHHTLSIGKNALIRSGSILYAGSQIGTHFQSGHRVTIREETEIGNYTSIGTLSDIQGKCTIGHYARLHSNVHIGQKSVVDSFVWIFPYVVLTNDPTPPSNHLEGVHVHPFAIITTSATILPGVNIYPDALVAAGATVGKDVEQYSVVGGVPARVIGDVRDITNRVTGEKAYPWRYYFDKYMPWHIVGFDSWYGGLSDDEKEQLGIDFVSRSKS